MMDSKDGGCYYKLPFVYFFEKVDDLSDKNVFFKMWA